MLPQNAGSSAQLVTLMAFDLFSYIYRKKKWPILGTLLLLSYGLLATDFDTMREEMLEEIQQDSLATWSATGRKSLTPEVMKAMHDVPRHQFVAKNFEDHSYANRPLPIGSQQTISQPFIVALMTDFLDLKSDHVVLEVGTGSGYQAAILSVLAKQVYSIEIIPELGTSAATRLKQLGYHNVTVRIGDGYHGWDAHAPFDAIIVTAAAEEIPTALIKQLRPGGRMMIPVGSQHQIQNLILVKKYPDLTHTTQNILAVRFVPLTGNH